MFKIFNLLSDTYISSFEPSRNFGRSEQLYINSASADAGSIISLDGNKEERTLINFDSDGILNYIGGIENIDDYEIFMEFYISEFSVVNDAFNVAGKKLTYDWNEGIGDDSGIFTTGVSWKNRKTGEPWDNEGGDFQIINYTGSTSDEILGEFINDEKLKFDLAGYLKSYSEGDLSDNGLILYTPHSTYNFSMYSSNSNFGLYPKIVIGKSDYVTTGSAELYSSEIKPYIYALNYQSHIQKNETFYAVLNVEEFYKRPSFSDNSNLKYLPNIKYKIYDEGRGGTFLDYSEFTKVPVKNDGLTIKFSTENIPIGSYSIHTKYENNGEVHYGNKLFFRIE